MFATGVDFELGQLRILRLRRMSPSSGRKAAPLSIGQCRLGAASEGDPQLLDFNGFGYGQGVLKFDAEVSESAVHLGVA